jgi:hypothetical protein
MATDDLKRLVAREIGHGESIADVARRHGYSWKGMPKLVRSTDVQRLIDQEREKLAELAKGRPTWLELFLVRALDVEDQLLRDDRDEIRRRASEYDWEQILPRRREKTPEVNSSDEGQVDTAAN